MYSKAKIFNLALSALLLTKKISDTDSDTSVENLILNTHYDTAFRMVLQDLDLDSTSTQKNLELIETDPNSLWKYSYKYPTDCSLFRRIQTTSLKDTRSTQIPRRIAENNGKKVIFTDAQDAVGEYISHNCSLGNLSASAGLAIAYRLAELSAPLIAGKGAANLRKELGARYIAVRAQAMEHDRMENANFETDTEMSEFVEERIS